MNVRTRIAVVVTAIAVLFGVTAAAQAGTLTGSTGSDACVVVPPAKVAVCVQRF